MKNNKFRFYSKETKKYVENQEDYVISADGTIYSLSDTRYYEDINPLNDVIISEQFTGLKDKNGVEIYEGDIVQMYYQPINEFGHKKAKTTRFKPTGLNQYTAVGDMLDIRRVLWSAGALMLRCYDGATGHMKSFNDLANPGESFEVIGNIHQNPELLK